MLTESDAKDIAMAALAPGSVYVKTVSYGDFYILQIIGPDEAEGNLDPFFSVNKKTGAFRDFSLGDGGPELVRQFATPA